MTNQTEQKEYAIELNIDQAYYIKIKAQSEAVAIDKARQRALELVKADDFVIGGIDEK